MNEQVETQDTNDYKQLYGDFRNAINVARDMYKTHLSNTKDLIQVKEEELRILKIRLHKLEGAIEASDGYLSSVLPNNNKKNGDIR